MRHSTASQSMVEAIWPNAVRTSILAGLGVTDRRKSSGVTRDGLEVGAHQLPRGQIETDLEISPDT
jgi:hypothetical protein